MPHGSQFRSVTLPPGDVARVEAIVAERVREAAEARRCDPFADRSSVVGAATAPSVLRDVVYVGLCRVDLARAAAALWEVPAGPELAETTASRSPLQSAARSAALEGLLDLLATYALGQPLDVVAPVEEGSLDAQVRGLLAGEERLRRLRVGEEAARVLLGLPPAWLEEVRDAVCGARVCDADEEP